MQELTGDEMICCCGWGKNFEGVNPIQRYEGPVLFEVGTHKTRNGLDLRNGTDRYGDELCGRIGKSRVSWEGNGRCFAYDGWMEGWPPHEELDLVE